jgi:hypothetical protein
MLPLIFRDHAFVRYIRITLPWFALSLFFVGVQVSGRVAVTDNYQGEKVAPSEDWPDGACQTRLMATSLLPAGAVGCLGLSILALLPVRRGEMP